MSLTTWLTGIVPAVVIVSVFLSAVTSVFLLWLYRRATLRAMGKETGFVQPLSGQHVFNTGSEIDRPALRFRTWKKDGAPVQSDSAKATYNETASSLVGLLSVYALAGLAYAVIMTVPWMINAGGDFVASRFLWLLIVHYWPIVITISLVAAANRREVATLVLVYFSLTALIAGYVVVANTQVTFGELAFLWFFLSGFGTLLLLVFLNHRVRSVGPMVLAFMIAGVTGAFTVVEVLRNNDSLLRLLVEMGVAVGLSSVSIFALINLAGFVFLAIFGWKLLGWIGNMYREKKFSDQSITIDSIWLFFAIVQSLILAFNGLGWVLTGIMAFGSYKLTSRLGFALMSRRKTVAGEGPSLLLLRVFALGPRGERFFNAFSKWWRRIGNISLIAGPDLLAAAFEPHEFLDFLGGRLSRQFVRNKEDLEGRISAMDRRPDPDGRYRVTEFFCQTDTWQMTMQRLSRENSSILMDLRTFSQTNQGVLYELGQILNIVDLRRVLFLIDEATDRQFLEENLQHLWSVVEAGSPNLRQAEPTVVLLHETEPSRRSIRRLLLGLFDAPAMTRGQSPLAS